MSFEFESRSGAFDPAAERCGRGRTWRTRAIPRTARHALAVLTTAAVAAAQPASSNPAPAAPNAPSEQNPPPAPATPAVKPPELREFAEAEYPPAALAARVEADVQLRLTIDATGAVTACEIISPAGQGFDEAAQQAALRFRFSPAERAGRALPSRILYTYSFRLPPEPPPPPPAAVAPPSIAPPAPLAPNALSPSAAPPASSASQRPLEISVEGRRQPVYTPSAATAATKTATNLLEIPQSVQVISQQVLKDQQSQTLGNVLDNVSGVQRTGFDDVGLVPHFTVRGFELSPLGNFYRDGRPLALSLPPPVVLLERVEFLKGPSSVLYGQSEPGGVVNMVLKRPTRAPMLATSTRIGSYQTFAQTLDVAGPIGPTLGYRAVASYGVADSFRDLQHSVDAVAGGVVRWQPSSRWTVNVAGYQQHRRQAADSGLISGPPAEGQEYGNRAVDVPISRSLNEPWTHVEVDATWATYDVTFRALDELEITQSFSYQRQENDELRADPISVQRDIPTLGLPAGHVSKTQRSRHTEQLSLYADLRAVLRFETGPLSHQLLGGVDYFRSIIGFRDYLPVNTDPTDFNVFAPVYRAPHPLVGSRLLTLSRNTLDQGGLYAQDQITALDDLHLLAGVRADRYGNDNERSRFDSGAYTLVNQTQSNVTYRVGATWEPWPDVAPFAGYSQAFRPNLVPFGNDLQPPERSAQWEAGLKAYLFEGAILATLTGFWLEKRNVLIENPATQALSLAGKRRSRGGELDVLGEPVPGMNVLLTYSLLEARVTSGDPRPIGTPGVGTTDITGNTPPAAPTHSGRVWVTYRFDELPWQGVRVGGGAFARSEAQGDVYDTLQHPGYARFDAMLGWSRLFGALELGVQLNVENLTDVVYFDGRNRERITPGAPTTVFALFSAEFTGSEDGRSHD